MRTNQNACITELIIENKIEQRNLETNFWRVFRLFAKNYGDHSHVLRNRALSPFCVCSILSDSYFGVLNENDSEKKIQSLVIRSQIANRVNQEESNATETLKYTFSILRLFLSSFPSGSPSQGSQATFDCKMFSHTSKKRI